MIMRPPADGILYKWYEYKG